MLDPAELDAALERMRPGRVAVVPDRHGTGTNALLLDPPEAIEPSFGPGSFERHRGAAEAAGATLSVERPAGLVLDVDTGDDLRSLLDALDARPGVAPATRAALRGARVTA
jgi:2-phospho-L-lactate guanylyltransferase